MSLEPEEQEKPEHVDALIDSTEGILESEIKGWVDQVQKAPEQMREEPVGSERKDAH